MPYYYGNYGSGNRGFLGGTPPVTRNLIILNIIVFIATLINRDFMTAEFALFYPTSRYFHWWQVLTHMFLHGGFWHILFNMLWLFWFGDLFLRFFRHIVITFIMSCCGYGSFVCPVSYCKNLLCLSS